MRHLNKETRAKLKQTRKLLVSQMNHQRLYLLELQSSDVNNHFDLVKELLNKQVTILKSSIIPLLPDHIQGHTQHHSMSLMHTIFFVAMRLNILQNRLPVASIDAHIHPSHSTCLHIISKFTSKE